MIKTRVTALRDDRFGWLRARESADLGYRLIVASRCQRGIDPTRPMSPPAA